MHVARLSKVGPAEEVHIVGGFWTDENQFEIIRPVQAGQLPEQASDEDAFAAACFAGDEEVRYLIQALPERLKI